jgi:glutathione S-transferase
MNLKLIYVDTTFWRAEVARLTLFIGDIEFEDVRIKREDFIQAKSSGVLEDGTTLPFRQIPCLVVDGVSIAQTAGIARFCGKLAGLYPKEDDVKAALVDQFVDFATDLNVMVSSTGSIKDQDSKLKARQELADGPLKQKLEILEGLIPDNSDFIMASGLSIADIAIWRILGWLSSGMLDGLPTDILSPFPNIKRVCLAVDGHQKVQRWISETYPANYVRGNY